jgi:hypothetical protein
MAAIVRFLSKNLMGFVDPAPAHSIIGQHLAVCDHRHSVERRGFTIPFTIPLASRLEGIP